MIFHYGSIIVNANAKIGDYSIIYPGVVIGAGSKIMGGGKNWQQCYDCSKCSCR